MALSCSCCNCCSLVLLEVLCGCRLAMVNDGLGCGGVGTWGCLSCIAVSMWHRSVSVSYICYSKVLLFFCFHNCTVCGREVHMLCTFCCASCCPSGLWSLCHWNRWIGYHGYDQHSVAMGFSFGDLGDLGDQGEHSRCLPDHGNFENLKCS